MKSISAFSPAHITGFFSSHYDDIDLLKTGSIGAGFSIDKGVITTIAKHSDATMPTEIYINNQLVNARVSYKTLEIFHKQYSLDKNISYRIEHRIEVPMGCGFGTSGAGALSLSLALHRFHGISRPLEEMAQIAHKAEVLLKTGLGTVTAETYGGMEIRITPGAPGFCQLDFIDYDSYQAAFCVWGEIDTSKALENEDLKKSIGEIGKSLVKDIVKTPDIDTFLKFSYTFTKQIQLLPEKVQQIMEVFKKNGLFASMLMFGEGVFVLYKEEQEDIVKKILSHYDNEAKIIFSSIEPKGVRFLEENNRT